MNTKFRERFAKLSQMNATTTTAKIGRGQDFETLINDIFEDEGLLLRRSYYTSDNKAEQIDGAIEVLNRIILFEVKWVESGLAASDLFSFIGKIDNKLIGTLGLFISKEELTENFVNSLSKGRRRKVLLLHGNDIQALFDSDLPLKDYLSYCIRRYSFDNILHYDVASFVKSQKITELSAKTPLTIPKNSTNIQSVLSVLFGDARLEEYAIDFELQKLEPEDKRQLAIYLLEKYPQYYSDFISALFSSKTRNQFSNVKYALSELVKQKEVKTDIVDRYYKLYCGSGKERYLEDFLWESFKGYYESIKEKEDFQNTLYNNFKDIIGDYDSENILTRVIKDVWPTLAKELQKKFLYQYLEIYFSSRKENFDQKRFARELITSKEYKPTFKKWIESKIVEELNSANVQDTDIETEVNYFARRYKYMMYALDLDEAGWHEFITDLYKALSKQELRVKANE